MRTTRISLAAALLAMQAVLLPEISVGQAPPPPPPPEARGPRPVPGPKARPGLATEEDAIGEIRRAYDHLNGVGGLAASGNSGDPSVTPLIAGGKRAYETALSRFQTGNYTSAREQAAAANDLAAAVDGLLRRPAGAAKGGNLGLKAPPDVRLTPEAAYRVKLDALRASEHAERLGSVVGSLPPTEPARQVAGLAQALAASARRAAEDGKTVEGRDLTGAAEAASRATDHLYTDYYASRGSAPPQDAGPAASPPDGPPPAPVR